MKCRHCRNPLKHTFLDLGYTPPSNAYLSKKQLSFPETSLPLKIKVCDNCWLVQTENNIDAEYFLLMIMHIFQVLQMSG